MLFSKWGFVANPTLIGFCLVMMGATAQAQQQDIHAGNQDPTVALLFHAHAHNDYLHARPLLDALDKGFCSVEADIFLVDGELRVGHSRRELKQGRTLESLYLDPLKERVSKNEGRVYRGGPVFTLLIDIKTDGEVVYQHLHQVLAGYEDILCRVEDGQFDEGAIQVVISGDRPIDTITRQKIRFAGIDGRLTDLDSELPAHAMPMISDRWGAHFKWRGVGPIPGEEREKLSSIVSQAHDKGRRIRFWATPEKPVVWQILLEEKVDHLSTDDLEGFAIFQNSSDETTNESGDESSDEAWEKFRGQPGPTGWRCNVIQPDPDNHGPDGINLHDWDGDGDLDLFSNAEEGKYSRLYFNPGRGKVRDYWNDFIEFKHGKCEDSGIGDLDNDGAVDYIANGGWVYFNPGTAQVRDPAKWEKMTLFDQEQRVPTVFDVDGDGLNDLIVGAQAWYKQPATDKRNAANWKRFTIGKNRWAMNCIMVDVDKDGDCDMVVPDRGIEVCWYENPGQEKITQPWLRKTIHSHTEPMFMQVADVNGDAIDDFVITGGSQGEMAKKLLILLRTNKVGDPQFQPIVIDQPSGNFPKGVAITDLDGDPGKKEILIIPKQGDIWTATFTGDPFKASSWIATPINIPGAETRKKMDNAWLGDLDGDGDLDVVTTEENGHWGVIWFENPER